MLPKSKRLNLKKDFKWVAAGQKLETKYLKLFIKYGDNIPKVGIAVSSRVFRKATERNKAKRLISKAFEVLYNKLPGGINIVALPKIGVLRVKSNDLFLDLAGLLKDEKIIN